MYNERQKYNEWEFLYDMKKDKRIVGAAAGMNTNQQPGNPLGNTVGNSNVPNPMTNSGPNSSFGQQPGGFNQGQGGFNQGQGGFNQWQGGFNQGNQQQQPLPIPGFPQPGRR